MSHRVTFDIPESKPPVFLCMYPQPYGVGLCYVGENDEPVIIGRIIKFTFGAAWNDVDNRPERSVVFDDRVLDPKHSAYEGHFKALAALKDYGFTISYGKPG